MIIVLTVNKPNPELQNFAEDIFALKPNVYNLPIKNDPFFELLYRAGVRQIIHDGSTNEIHCIDGYLYAQNIAAGLETKDQDVLRLRRS